MKGQLFLALALITGLARSTAQAETHTVPTSFPTIEAALAAAQPGDHIEIAPGTYRESGLVLPEGVNLVGMGIIPDETVIDAQGLDRVLLVESVVQVSQLQNLTMTGGMATGPTTYDRSGGAILVNNSFLKVTNCLFIGNEAEAHGGAVRATNSTLIISNCGFDANTAPNGGGGAIDCSYDTSPLVRTCRFEKNTASWGGAISCRANSSPMISDSYFQDNDAVGDLGLGGAIFSDNQAHPVFTSCTFHRNSARYGGALACLQDSETNLESCTLVSNTSTVDGGGLFTNDASPRVSCSIIAFQIGTGISAQGTAVLDIQTTDVYGNSGGDWIGALGGLDIISGNMSADPLFCWEDPGPGQGFTIQPESPCANLLDTCDYLGAWPIDCLVTPVTLGIFEADWYHGQARLTWQLTGEATPPPFLLTGFNEDEPEREWVIDYQYDGSNAFTALDPLVEEIDGIRFGFRLYIPGKDGGWALLAETSLAPPLPGFPDIRKLAASPNPFNPMTTISFELGQAQSTRVTIYSLNGGRVRTIAEGSLEAGLHEFIWDGRNQSGRLMGSGPYFALVEGEEATRTIKVTLLK